MKRLVYSTCSVHKEVSYTDCMYCSVREIYWAFPTNISGTTIYFVQENECVVRDALVNYGSQYELEHIMPHWTSRGQEVEDFPKGTECTLVHDVH